MDRGISGDVGCGRIKGGVIELGQQVGGGKGMANDEVIMDC
jgi:hypothetical protein